MNNLRQRRVRRQRSGATLLELLIVMEVLAIIFAMAIPNLLISRQSANEASCGESVKLIIEAEANYRTKYGLYGTLPALGTAGVLDPSVASAVSIPKARSGYYFAVTVIATNKNQYFVTASPAGTGGGHVIYADESGLLFSAPAGTTLPTTDAAGTLSALGAGWTIAGN